MLWPVYGRILKHNATTSGMTASHFWSLTTDSRAPVASDPIHSSVHFLAIFGNLKFQRLFILRHKKRKTNDTALLTHLTLWLKPKWSNYIDLLGLRINFYLILFFLVCLPSIHFFMSSLLCCRLESVLQKPSGCDQSTHRLAFAVTNTVPYVIGRALIAFKRWTIVLGNARAWF